MTFPNTSGSADQIVARAQKGEASPLEILDVVAELDQKISEKQDELDRVKDELEATIDDLREQIKRLEEDQ